MRAVIFSAVMLGASALLGSPTTVASPGPSVAKAAVYVQCENTTSDVCASQANSDFVFCISRHNTEHEDTIGGTPGGPNDCPQRAQIYYESCMFSSGCGYSDFPTDMPDYIWN